MLIARKMLQVPRHVDKKRHKRSKRLAFFDCRLENHRGYFDSQNGWSQTSSANTGSQCFSSKRSIQLVNRRRASNLRAPRASSTRVDGSGIVVNVQSVTVSETLASTVNESSSEPGAAAPGKSSSSE
jgi:hypothetical protein